MIINQNILAIHFQICKKKLWKTLHQGVNFQSCYYWISKIPNRKKVFNEQFNFSETKISLDEIIKSINSQTYNKSPCNNGFVPESYKRLSNELASVLLDVYESWGKLGTMVVTFRTGIMSVIYKAGDKKDIENHRPVYYNC